MVGVCETQAEPSDNGLTELKRGIGQVPRKLTKGTTPFFRDINRGPAEAQSVSTKFQTTRSTSVKYAVSYESVNPLSRAVRKLLNISLITPVRDSIRVRTCEQVAIGITSHTPLRLLFGRSPRTTDFLGHPLRIPTRYLGPN
ncbi:hypothetical protein G5I_13228 [Acromyrmex echinatior]|uniref:Uncharacterized protein n=1 Tax=Acromyrmex echinatior TaxID=103372 RepID=F4X4G7_ACREC|nr:hypothetical protein G5I_13228 [Acromyrmex echinatior]